jgi:predicted small lipoprotein YifL
MTRPLTLLAAALAALALAGCGVQDPLNDQPAETRTAPPATTAATTTAVDAGANSDAEPPRDTRDPESLTSPHTRPNADAEEVAAAYGLAQTNWSWRTYATQYRRMTELAGGALARDLKANPPEQDQLEGLKADRQTNRSSTIAVDSQVLSPTKTRVIVVYQELGGGAGVTEMAPRHTVYRAVVTKLDNGWKVTQWSHLP